MLRFKISKLKNFWPGFFLGLAYFFYIFWWLWNLYPLDSFGIENKLIGFILIFFLFLIGSSSMAVWWGIAGFFAIKFLALKKIIWLIPLIWSGIFVLAEYLRSLFFGLVFFGGGSIIGPDWTIGNLAYLFHDFDLILKSSSLWGIYGIDFLLAYLAGSLIIFIKQKKLPNLFALAAVPAIFIGSSFLIVRGEDALTIGDALPIAIVQTSFPTKSSYTSEENLNNFQEKLDLLKKSSQFLNSEESTGKKGIIVLPEGAHFLNSLSVFLNENAIKKYFDNLSENEILIIDQVKSLEKDELKSRVVLINSKTGLIGTYDKKLLTPGGEFTPYLIRLPLLIFYPESRKFISPDVKPGSDSNILEFNGNKLKIVVCSELLSPSIAGSGNGDFIIALHNFGLFNGGRLLEREIRSMSKFRAAENGKYSVTSSNLGQSYIINYAGKVEKKASGTGYELLTGYIAPNKDQTWYNYVGDWPILLLSSVLLAFGLKKIKDDAES